MRIFSRAKMLPAVPLMLLLMMMQCGLALDFNDVLAMQQNGLPENVIVEQVRLSGGVSATPEQAARLRSAGASEQVIAALTAIAAPSVPVAAQVDDVVVRAAPPAARPVAEPIRPVAITTIGARPGLYAKEGWLSVSNSDVISYYLEMNLQSKRMFLSRQPNGGVEIPSGHDLTFNLRKETYKIYGDSGNDLSLKVREGEPTRLSLTPFGVFGNSGLTGTAQDRDRVRSEVLFNNYTPPPAVIVRPPVVIAEPPPVVVVPGPPVYYPRPYRRYYYNYGW